MNSKIKIICFIIVLFLLAPFEYANASTYRAPLCSTGIRPLDFFVMLCESLGYPSRYISCLLQRDEYAAELETKRFIYTATLGHISP